MNTTGKARRQVSALSDSDKGILLVIAMIVVPVSFCASWIVLLA